MNVAVGTGVSVFVGDNMIVAVGSDVDVALGTVTGFFKSKRPIKFRYLKPKKAAAAASIPIKMNKIGFPPFDCGGRT